MSVTWTGDPEAAMVGMIEMLQRLSLLPAHPAAQLADVGRPPVLGAGAAVGHLEPVDA